jgi:hypothetical protein
LGDKFRPATSFMTIACTSAKRYFDLDAVREALADSPGNQYVRQPTARQTEMRETRGPGGSDRAIAPNPAGAPPLDWWEISTQPYKGSHYATWPTALLERPIKAMCPLRVCRVCGKPSERVVESHSTDTQGNVLTEQYRGSNATQRTMVGYEHLLSKSPTPSFRRVVTGETWTDCGHDDWRTGVVLDPFGGSGTTLEVAQGLGRDAIGIDLDERNADLARERVGMFLTVIDKGEVTR